MSNPPGKEKVCVGEWSTSIILDGHLHCTSGPAWFSHDGSRMEWRINGKLHRIDGPAVIYSRYDDVAVAYTWALDGAVYHKFSEWLMINDRISDGEKVLLSLEYS